ncbi:unnamed protein product [Effrenium voratum]|nr:unnamed protein product [Effrenium voratum]
MDPLQLPPARPCLLKEVPTLSLGSSVRVTGEVKEIQQAPKPLILLHDREAVLCVDAGSLVRPVQATPGMLLQAVGELAAEGNQQMLRARIVRVVSGLDLELYERCLAVRRQFEAEYLQ